MARILLINPNTNTATTEVMLAIARDAAPAGVKVEGVSARFGADLIETEDALETASRAVAEILNSRTAGYDGVVISAFGDPGLHLAPSGLNIVGIAEAGIKTAAEAGRRFSIVTTTPGLGNAIRRLVVRYGQEDQFVSLRGIEGPAQASMRDPAALTDALRGAISDAREVDGAEAVVIGSGPLASVARQLAHELAVPVVEPIPSAIRLLSQRIGAR